MALASPGNWRTSTAWMKVTAMRSGYRIDQCTPPGGVLFASWATAALIPRHTAAPLSSPGGYEFAGSGGPFLDRLVGIALEHMLRRRPDVDLPDRALTPQPIAHRGRHSH